MVFHTIALSTITLLLFSLLLSRKAGRVPAQSCLPCGTCLIPALWGPVRADVCRKKLHKEQKRRMEANV